MKMKRMLEFLRPQEELIATFGQAQLVRMLDGKSELRGGTAEGEGVDLDVLAGKQRAVQGIARLHRVFDVQKLPLAFNLWPIRQQRHEDA